ncbi:RNA-guided endonuclease InsQ/TnpB family protein [Lentzea sp. JNUCC 0626]|uniref:RNA-guided endonuclease InsQ/TnpB family protein n=1 Tax=Lentzea sp. JNUCC 0626 TaxID=3367513 RepID=UPI0037497579
MLNRTFGCVRLVWNKALGERAQRFRVDGARTSYRETDAALTAWKRTEELAFLSEVSSVPLQQALRHQHTAFQNFFARRARYPRFKSRTGRQSAHYTRSALVPAAPTRHAIGVDLGLAGFLVTSDRNRIANPRHLAVKARNLARHQRKLAWCALRTSSRSRT